MPRDISEKRKEQIEAVSDTLLKNAEKIALDILTRHESLYRQLVEKLLERETVDGKDIYELMGEAVEPIHINTLEAEL